MRGEKEEILNRINDEETIRLLQDLIRIPSVNPPGKERRVVEFLAEKLEKMGFEVKISEAYPDRPNLYAQLKGEVGRPKLIYNNHVDVVPPGEGWSKEPFSAEIRDDKIFGRGACDVKGSLAAMVGAVEAIISSDVELKGDLVIAAVVDEEERQGGTKQLIKDGVRGDFCIVAEPSNLIPYVAHKGSAPIEITTKGKASHSSVPHKGINAIVKMCKVIGGIEKMSETLKEKRHKLLGSPTLSIGLIEGGVTTWSVAPKCRISVDRRTLPGENIQFLYREFEYMIGHIKEEDPEFQADIKIGTVAPPYEVSSDERIVKMLRDSIEEVLMKRVDVQGAPFTCDAGVYMEATKIPTVVFGPGDIGVCHAPDEYLSIGELTAAARIYALTVLKALN